jgi:hypothetical protein
MARSGTHGYEKAVSRLAKIGRLCLTQISDQWVFRFRVNLIKTMADETVNAFDTE